MAIVAIVAGLDVGRVLARRDGAVMARATGTHDLRVVDRIGRHPQRVVMAVLTNIGGLDMPRILAGGANTVVTGRAATNDAGVIKVGRYPCHRCMAVVTVVATDDMRGVLARSNCAVVAGTTGTQYLGVINQVGRCPQGAVVAVLANFGGPDVCRILASRIDAVMATGTIGSDVSVVESRWQPSRRGVAVVAIVAAREVSRVLA